MRFDYTLTPDDLRAATRPVRVDGRPATRRRPGRGMIGWVLFAALATLLVYLGTVADGPTAPSGVPGPSGPLLLNPLRPPPQNLWVTLLPSLIPAAFLALLVVSGTGRQSRRTRLVIRSAAAGRPVPPESSGRRSGAWFGIAVFGLASTLVLYDLPAVAVPWRPTPALALLVGFSPWLAAAVVLPVVLSLYTRRAADRLWAATPALRRRLSADVSDAGVWTTDGVTDTLHRWPAVTRYRETDGLLVLTLEDARVLALPKRAVPDAEDALRGLIQTHVADGSFLPRSAAFPVLAVPG